MRRVTWTLHFLLFFQQEPIHRSHGGEKTRTGGKKGRTDSVLAAGGGRGDWNGPHTCVCWLLPWTLWSWSSCRMVMVTVWLFSISRRAASWLPVMSSTWGTVIGGYKEPGKGVSIIILSDQKKSSGAPYVKERSFRTSCSQQWWWGGRIGSFGSPSCPLSGDANAEVGSAQGTSSQGCKSHLFPVPSLGDLALALEPSLNDSYNCQDIATKMNVPGSRVDPGIADLMVTYHHACL